MNPIIHTHTFEQSRPLEATKHRAIALQWCVGCGIDVGCGLDPISPRAVRVDRAPHVAHLFGDGRDLRWFRDGCMDYVHASHILEDFAVEDWPAVIGEWARVLKPGGNLLISVPEWERWRRAIDSGQPDNCDHRHEPRAGEVESFLPGWEILFSDFVRPDDYSMLVVARKPL